MQRASSLIGSVAGLFAGLGLLVALLLLSGAFRDERATFWLLLAGAFVAGAVVLFAVQCFRSLLRPALPDFPDPDDLLDADPPAACPLLADLVIVCSACGASC